MALTQKKISKGKQLRLALVLILVIGTTLGVAYFALLKKPTYKGDPVQQAPLQVIRSKIPQQTGFSAITELKDSVLFRQLRSFGIWPLPLEPKGRLQPFILNKAQEE